MIYEKVKELCKKNKISIASLEKTLSFSNGMISKWKTSSPKFSNMVTLAKFFDVSLDYFV